MLSHSVTRSQKDVFFNFVALTQWCLRRLWLHGSRWCARAAGFIAAKPVQGKWCDVTSYRYVGRVGLDNHEVGLDKANLIGIRHDGSD